MSEQTTTTARRFTLDEGKVREWLDKVVKAAEYALYGDGEDPAPGEDLPEITVDWNPMSPGNEIDISSLVRCAANSDIIGCPGDLDLDFEYSDDDDGGYYRFLVYVNASLMLTSYATEMRKLAGARDELRGIPAALAILDEAVTVANRQLACLDAYVANRTSMEG